MRDRPRAPLSRLTALSTLVETLLVNADPQRGLTRAEIKKALLDDHAELISGLPKSGHGSVDWAVDVRRIS